MGYYITIKNELLEAKHVEAMGPAVWLYMWLIDKVMAINENGLGKVLNGRPVTYEAVAEDLGVTVRTYRRWVSDLRAAGYIKTIQAPYGLVVTVTKAEKMWGQKASSRNAEMFPDERSAKSGTPKELKKEKPERCAKTRQPGVPKNVQGGTQFGTPKITTSIDKGNNNKKHGKQISRTDKSVIGSWYYKVIAAYHLPVANHNNIWAKIREWEAGESEEDAVAFMKFLIEVYPQMSFDKKPEISKDLDVYVKREAVKNAVRRVVQKSQRKVIREV